MEYQYQGWRSLGGDVVGKLIAYGAAFSVFLHVHESAGPLRKEDQIIEVPHFGFVKTSSLIHFVMLYDFGGGESIQIAHELFDATARSR